MAAGLQVFNDDGIIQLGEERYFNLFLIASGTASGDFNLPTRECIIATRPIGGWHTVMGIAPNGGGGRAIVNTSSGASFHYYAFTLSKDVSHRTNYGLEVFSASGELMFYTSDNPLKFSTGSYRSSNRRAWSGDPYKYQWLSATNIPNFNSKAFIQIGWRRAQADGALERLPTYSYLEGISRSGNNLQVGFYRIPDQVGVAGVGHSLPHLTGYPHPLITVIDVSNI